MALSLNPATRLFTILQSDLAFVSGTLYDMDTDALRLDILDLLDDEDFIWMPDAVNHNTEVTVAGVTYARTIEMINSFSIQLEDTGSAYTVRLTGSNNNLFDVQNGIFVPTNRVNIISTNSAGLQTVSSGSGLSPGEQLQLDEIYKRLDLDGDQTYADDGSTISNPSYTLTKSDNGDGTFDIDRS